MEENEQLTQLSVIHSYIPPRRVSAMGVLTYPLPPNHIDEIRLELYYEQMPLPYLNRDLTDETVYVLS